METIKRELDDYRVLMRSIPGSVLSLFIVSIIVMNLLANKEFFSVKYLALDCGFTMSWVSFLCMDMICKHFGPKAAVKVSVTALLVNLAVCVLFKLISLTPGMWAEYYTTGMIEVNDAERDGRRKLVRGLRQQYGDACLRRLQRVSEQLCG